MAESKKTKTKTATNSKFRNTFLIWFLIISVIPLSIVSFISFNIAHKAFRDNAVNSLINIANGKKEFLESFFLGKVIDVDFQSQEIANVQFLSDLKKSFIESGLPIEKYARSYEYAKLRVSHGGNLRNFQVSYGYVDVLLLDCEGNFLFSIGNRNREFIGTNLFTGKNAETNLAKACKKSISTGKPYLSDFEFCESDKYEIDCYIVQVVVDNEGHKIGLIALQLPIYSINKIMWDSTGLGDTGEAYLVGKDLLMRSDSRFSENSTILNVKVNTEGVKEWLIREINKGHINYINSKIDTLENIDKSVDNKRVESNKTFKANIYDGYRGVAVLGVTVNIELFEKLGVHWLLLTEVDEKEAFSSLYILRNN